MADFGFVKHIFVRPDQALPPVSGIYEYVVGKNGIFVRAERQGLAATIWVASTFAEVRGLSEKAPLFILDDYVPAGLLRNMLVQSYYSTGREILFYLRPAPWRLTIPAQVSGPFSVRPVDPYSAAMAAALIEAHSHYGMDPFFSMTDDYDERSGFRIYTVLGRLTGQMPAMLTRVGIYGYFWNIPSRWVYQMPVGVEDVNGFGDEEHRLTDERI